MTSRCFHFLHFIASFPFQTNSIASKSHEKYVSIDVSSKSTTNTANERDITLSEGLNNLEKSSSFVEQKDDACIDNLYGFIDDIEEVAEPAMASPPKNIQISKKVLSEKRKQLKRFLDNPSPRKSPRNKEKKRVEVVSPNKQAAPITPSNTVQKDIRNSFKPCTYVDYSKGPEKEANNPLQNFFGDTETERVSLSFSLSITSLLKHVVLCRNKTDEGATVGRLGAATRKSLYRKARASQRRKTRSKRSQRRKQRERPPTIKTNM